MTRTPTLLNQCDAAAAFGWSWRMVVPAGENRKRCAIDVRGEWLVVPADVWNVDGWARQQVQS